VQECKTWHCAQKLECFRTGLFVYLKQKHGEMQIDAEVALAPQTQDFVKAARR
jgi:hypothetical protein